MNCNSPSENAVLPTRSVRHGRASLRTQAGTSADLAAIGDLLCLMTCVVYQRQYLPEAPLYPVLTSRIAAQLLAISRSRGVSRSLRRQCSRLFDHWETLINGSAECDVQERIDAAALCTLPR
jgi:hypothetical protein